MSNFYRFCLPQLLRKETHHDDTIPPFKCNKLVVKDHIGLGAFGDAYTKDYQTPGKITTETVVRKKLFNAVDKEEKKLFFKEVALLNSLKHQSIVTFMAIRYQPLAMMLEYVYFDFYFFGQAVRVNSLSKFLLKLDEQNCGGFYDLVCHAATEIIDGLSYLHNQRVAHRDRKPANILVSNHHYNSLSVEDAAFARTYQARPIACKLTDFGDISSD